MKQWSTAIVPPQNRSTSFYFPFVSGRRPRTVDSYLSSNRQSPGNKSLVFSFMCEWERGVNAACIFSERLVILANEHAAHRGGVQDLEPMCFACTKLAWLTHFDQSVLVFVAKQWCFAATGTQCGPVSSARLGVPSERPSDFDLFHRLQN